MKTLIQIFVLVLVLANLAHADSASKTRLLGVHFSPEQATELDKQLGAAMPQTLLPKTTNTYDLGSSALKWKDVYLAGNITAVTYKNPGSTAGISFNSTALQLIGNSAVRFYTDSAGNLNSDGTNGGEVLFNKSGTGVRDVVSSAITPNALTGQAFATPANGAVLTAGNVNLLPAAMATAANFVALPAATANIGKTVVLAVPGAVSANVASSITGDTLNAGALYTPVACTTGVCHFRAVSNTAWVGK